MPNRHTPPFEYTAKQITDALLDAIREGRPDSLCESLLALLALHYPEDLQALNIALRLADHANDEATD
jgi:hypothetical protein